MNVQPSPTQSNPVQPCMPSRNLVQSPECKVESGEKFIPHYRLRDPAFFRIFQLMTTISRTFRKTGRRKSRLVRVGYDQFRSGRIGTTEPHTDKNMPMKSTFCIVNNSFAATWLWPDSGLKNQGKSIATFSNSRGGVGLVFGILTGTFGRRRRQLNAVQTPLAISAGGHRLPSVLFAVVE